MALKTPLTPSFSAPAAPLLAGSPTLALESDPILGYDFASDLAPNLAFDLALNRALSLALNFALDLVPDRDSDLALTFSLLPLTFSLDFIVADQSTVYFSPHFAGNHEHAWFLYPRF